MAIVLFLNGPPRSGKDTLGAELAKAYPGFEVVKFAKILKERAHALYGRPELPHDYFERVKDVTTPFFKGLTPRQAYINLSETYFKPVHGDQIFGELFIDEMTETYSHARGLIITDSGFESESLPVIHHFGEDNCVLVRIYAEQRYCSFAGDSRSFLTLPIETVHLTNNGTVDEFLTRGLSVLDRVLQPRLGGG